ncbi:hypothetical protein RvY_15969 [Ramazzottius varieornatus]|uniref:Uncharacterized protein n=1 Tax=Ramazzottius varieornatus TaxID=947166 RepID=A0A1D1VZU2_RAMVA|nr:hypothetical protein RvY_15969 [Ramazzottius varieornatus]
MADEEEDDFHDEIDIDPQHLIDDLKYSRHMVVVAERSMKNFNENLSHSRIVHNEEVGKLQDKRIEEEHIINSSKNGGNDFIFNMFVHHGRSQEEARSFIHSTPDKIKAALRRKILLKRRGLDILIYHKARAKQIKQENNTKRKISISNKTSGTDIIFRTKFPNYSMKRVARKTFDNAKCITNAATHIELIEDIAGKLAAVDGYLKEDATNFERTLKDLSVRTLR